MSDRVDCVWEKGRIDSDFDPSVWRRDDCDNLINRQSYGDRISAFGWEIDHIVPISQGGTDDISNLRPLQWEANVKRTG